jgi:hypothetical protein
MPSLAFRKKGVQHGMTNTRRKDGTMKLMDGPTLSATSIPPDFPETVETFADVLKTLGATETPELESWVQALAVESTNGLIARHGKLWVWQHRVRLAEELELLDEM